MKNVVHAACSHDCPDACGVLITVDDSGRATKIQGDPSHPVTRGFLCAKVAKYLDRVYSPDRVLYPMRRVKPKGKGPGGASDFTRITWDEAYEEIAHRFTAISQQFGPEAILPYSYAGNLGALGYASMDRRFFYRLGASQLDRTICSTTGGEGLVSVLGRKLGALARTNQVLCVTHLPQIACMAATHFRVRKEVAGNRAVHTKRGRQSALTGICPSILALMWRSPWV